MSLTSINNFFFFQREICLLLSLSLSLHTLTCALWFFFFDFWLYLNCKYQSQSSINHSPFPLLSTPAHKSIKRRLAPVTIFTTIRGRGELRWGERHVRTCEWRCQFEGNNNKLNRINVIWGIPFLHMETPVQHCFILLYFLFDFLFVSEFDSSSTHTVGQVVCARFKLCCAIMIRTVCLATTQSSHTHTHTQPNLA